MPNAERLARTRKYRADSQCREKKHYKYESEAKKKARACAVAWGEPAYVYACDICHGWHLTRQLKGVMPTTWAALP